MVSLQLTSREDVEAPWVDDEQALDAALAALAEEARAAGQLHLIGLGTKKGRSRSLSLVLGGDETVLIFGFKGRRPPYCHSLGADRASKQQIRCYSMRKHEVSIPRRLLIPMEQALQAVREFAATGDRPESITWEEMVH